MKRSLTIRKGILLLLALFGLIIGGTLFFTVRYIRGCYVLNEYENGIDILEILGRQVDENLKNGNEDPYSFLEMFSCFEAVEENFAYLVRDSTGTVLAPSFAAGKELPVTHIRWLTPDQGCCIADLWRQKCFIVFYPIPDRPLEMVAVYGDDYLFAEMYRTFKLFIIFLSALYIALVLLSWFWIIPSLERTIDRKNQVERELVAARKLQLRAVTTSFPPNPVFDVHAVLQPAREVGGDIYRYGVKDGKLHFVIGDVSDKGTPAALLMFTLSSFIRFRTHGSVPVCDLMKALNRLVCDNAEYEMLCTLFAGTVDGETLEMEYCNAGHTRTLVNGIVLDQDPQLIAGLDSDYPYHSQKVQLHHGDRLLLYTDGVTEARSEDRSFFGEKRLQDWMKAQDPSLSSEEACRSLLDTLAAFRGKASQNDDIAIIYIRIV